MREARASRCAGEDHDAEPAVEVPRLDREMREIHSSVAKWNDQRIKDPADNTATRVVARRQPRCNNRADIVMKSQQTFVITITANFCDRNHSAHTHGGVALHVSVGENRRAGVGSYRPND
jgi:hypothetical protein